MSFLLLLLISFSERNYTVPHGIYQFETVYKLEPINFHLYIVEEHGGRYQYGWQIQYGRFLVGVGTCREKLKTYVYVFWYDLDRKHYCIVFEDPRKRE